MPSKFKAAKRNLGAKTLNAMVSANMIKGHVTKVTGTQRVAALIESLQPIAPPVPFIRLGPEGDGGYLVPDDLQDIEACFSPGVSFVSGFEKDCAELGMNVFLADKSVEQPAEPHERFHFTQKYIGATSNSDYLTLEQWVTHSGVQRESDLLLQIDIEGAEYESFLSASDALMERFRIVVAEFHMLHELWNSPFYTLASRVFEKLLQTHACVHLHPNNCCGAVRRKDLDIPRVMEFTFLRKDRLGEFALRTDFPHPLDSDNTDNESLPLANCWYGRAKGMSAT